MIISAMRHNADIEAINVGNLFRPKAEIQGSEFDAAKLPFVVGRNAGLTGRPAG